MTRLCLCGCGEPVLSKPRPSRPRQGYRRGHCKRVAMPELVPADPVLRVLARYDDPLAVVAHALGIQRNSARQNLARWTDDGHRIRRTVAERILRFVVDLPRAPTKRQIDTTSERAQLVRRLRFAREVGNTGLTLTTAEMAVLQGTTTKSIQRWADAGNLPHVRTPEGYRLFPGVAILDLIENSQEAVSA